MAIKSTAASEVYAELDTKIAAAGDDLDKIWKLLRKNLEDNTDEVEENNKRLGIIAHQLEAYESLYLDVRRACLDEEDYHEACIDDGYYPQHRILNYTTDHVLGYDNNRNTYQLLVSDTPDEIHADLKRTRPAIENFNTYMPAMNVFLILCTMFLIL
jgi:hypothetical protein